jgi:uncharacterized damage-inducible protein DinB
MWAHSEWADTVLLAALRAAPDAADAWLELAHVIAADAVWLSRLEQRSNAPALWDRRTPDDIAELRAEVSSGYRAYFERLTPAMLDTMVTYTNTKGTRFETAVGDILLQVMLHAQYHRGKVNLLLRQSGAEPAPVDYIAFVRGAPAATTPVAR